MLALAGLVPDLTDGNSHVRQELSEEAAALLQLSLAALVDVASVFPSVIRNDLHACIIHVFAAILSAGSCQAVATPQSLQVFKRFLMLVTRSPDRSTVGQLRNGLNRFLGVLKYAQRREFEASLACEKNTLLALTVLLTTAGGTFNARDPLLRRVADEMMDCLGNRMTTKVAAGCCRSLMAMQHKTAAVATISARLLPLLIEFLIHPVDVEGMDETRSSVARTLCEFVSTLPPAHRRPALTLVMPALLAMTSYEGEKSYTEVALGFIELAKLDQVVFKSVADCLTPATKDLMKRVLQKGGPGRYGASGTGSADTNGEHEPSIALKLDFGLA